MWGEALGGAATGAGTGFMFGGPVGAAVGGGLGLGLGVLGAKDKERKLKAQNMYEAEKTRYSPWTKAGIGQLGVEEPEINSALQGVGAGAGLYQAALRNKRDEERLARGLPSARETMPIIINPAQSGPFSQGINFNPNPSLGLY